MRSLLHRGPVLPMLAIGLLLGIAASAQGHTLGYDLSGFQQPSELQTRLHAFLDSGVDIQEIAASYDGEWLIVSQGRVVSSAGVPRSLIAKIEEYLDLDLEIDVVAFTPNGGWIVIAEHVAWHSGGISYVDELEAAILERINAGERLTELCFDADGDGWSLVSGAWAQSMAMDPEVYSALLDRHCSKRRVQQICMNIKGAFGFIADDWAATRAVTPLCYSWLRNFASEEKSMDHFALSPEGGWILYSHGSYSPNPDSAIHSLEYELIDDEGKVKNLWQRMKDLDVPGVSLALVEGNNVRWARGYGELEVGTQRFVLTTSPFDAASIAKGVAAMGIMALADWQHELDLELDTTLAKVAGNDGKWNDLTTWMFAGWANKGFMMPIQQITLRQLLSHQALMVPHGAANRPAGDAPPTTVQKLLGQKTENGPLFTNRMCWYDPNAADGGPWLPGETWDYSGGGFMVAEAMSEVLSDIPFADLMDLYVLGPLSMKDSTFHQPLDPSFESRRALPHIDGAVVPPADRVYYPWSAAGGLFASAKDFAQFQITLMQGGIAPTGGRLLEAGSVRQMLRDQFPGDTMYGLGLGLSSTLVHPNNSSDEYFSHGGSHGGVRTIHAGSPRGQQALVVMINAGGEEHGELLRAELLTAFGKFHGWPGF